MRVALLMLSCVCRRLRNAPPVACDGHDEVDARVHARVGLLLGTLMMTMMRVEF